MPGPRRRAGPGVARPRRRRRKGARVPRAADEALTISYPTSPNWPATLRCAPSASTWRSPTPAPAPTSCTRTPGTPTWPATSPAPARRPHVVTAHSLEPLRPEGRAARRRVRRSGSSDLLPRGLRVIAVSAAMRDDVLRSIPGSTRPASTSCTTASTPPTGSRPATRTACASSVSTRTGPRSCSSAGSPGRRGCRCSCAPWPSCRPTSRSCSAPGTGHPGDRGRGGGAGRVARGVPRRRRVDPRDAPPRRRGGAADRRDGVRVPVDLRAARHRQPRGDGCETAVVATATGGIPEVVMHGETGLLVPTTRPPTAPGRHWIPSSTSPTSPPP